jgi:3',5'-cyclic AMP phosphodiesterase CpdA
MPIKLPPISRRQFLRRSLLGGLAVGLAHDVFAAKRAPVDANFFAFLSDTHLAAQREQLGQGINMVDHFEKVSRELLSLPQRPAGLFISGDCAYSSGEKGDYAMLTQMLDPVRASQIPVHIALGNHDHRERFWEVLSKEKSSKRPLVDKQVALLKTRHANWFILDSLETTLSTPGLIGREQLDWLASALDANQKKPALVMVHHNPGLTGNMGLKDTMAFLEIIRPRRQVKAYIYGHTHTWRIDQDNSGIHLVNLPPVAYVFAKGEPSGWVRAGLQPDGISLELRSLDPAHKAHAQTTVLKWRA